MYTAPYYTIRDLEVHSRKTLGRLLAHTLAEQAGVPHTGPDLARWYEQQHRQVPYEQDDKRWKALFREGKIISPELLRELTSAFPILRDELENILWPALCTDAPRGLSWEEFCRQLRVELTVNLSDPKSIDLLSSCVSMKYVSVLLLIIRTKSDWYGANRVRASLRFPKFLQVLCVTSPLSYIADELYGIISALLLQDYICGSAFWSEWPLSAVEFRAGVKRYRCLIGELMDRGWFNDQGPDLQIFLAMLINKPHDFSELPSMLLGRKPDWVAARIRRQARGLSDWQKGIKSRRWRLQDFYGEVSSGPED